MISHRNETVTSRKTIFPSKFWVSDSGRGSRLKPQLENRLRRRLRKMKMTIKQSQSKLKLLKLRIKLLAVLSIKITYKNVLEKMLPKGACGTATAPAVTLRKLERR